MMVQAESEKSTFENATFLKFLRLDMSVKKPGHMLQVTVRMLNKIVRSNVYGEYEI